MPAFDPGILPIPSESSAILTENFQAIEDAMLGEYKDVWSDCTSPIRGFLEDGCTMADQNALLEYPQDSLEDLKVEVPLMLDEAFDLPEPFGPDAFKDFIDREFEHDPEFGTAPIRCLSDDNIEEQLMEAAKPAIQSVEQEQLQAIDAIGRVSIPIMDFSTPEPEWTRLCNNARAVFKWIRNGNEQLFKPPSWPTHKATESKLIWSPFPARAISMPAIEGIEVEESVILTSLNPSNENELPSSLDFVCQRDMPVVFKDEDWDEDIDTLLCRNPSKTPLMEIVRKRSMEVDTNRSSKKPRHTVQKRITDQNPESDASSLLPVDSPGASAKLLANFMEVHAPKRRAWTHSKFFASLKSDSSTLPLPAETTKHIRSPNGARKHAGYPISQQAEASFNAPSPHIKPPVTPLTIFISIKIPRRMIRVLEGLVPDLTIIERNYDAHNASIWRPGSVIRTEVVPPLADDADITVSPTTGLIVASMIRIRQKPREGSSKGIVQTQIEKTSLRYERLFVLVGGEGGGDDTLCGMSSSDSTAIQELQGYASGLDCNVQVHYVGGGAKTLANWVASFICRYGLAEPSISTRLLEEETLWELFLRRAGFNVFAAQAVASQLKQSNNEPNSTPSQYGLGEFVTMTRAERQRRFGQLVGPKLLERVSDVVDELWNQG